MAEHRLIKKNKKRMEKEIGTIYKSHGGRLRFALAFPNTYYVGMSNLGFQIVYRILNEQDDAVCERLFLPDAQDLQEISRTNMPLFTMESQTPVRDFDILAFSLSYELDYPNVLKILSLSGVEALSSKRRIGRSAPLVIAGGPAATFNPEPMAPFVDAFIIGEAEELIPELVGVLVEHRQSERLELLMRLTQIKGIYVPDFYQPEYVDDGTIKRVVITPGAPEKIHRRRVYDIDKYPAISTILTPETEFSNMVLAEVARGCGRHCRFCVAGHMYLPPRPRSPEVVLKDIRRREDKGIENPRIGLLSASVFDHPSSLLICQALLDRGLHFSISSTRADTLNHDIAEALHKGGHRTLTIAPEAGSDRLRCVINKAMTDNDILRAASIAWDGGFRRLKLYFMVGLPTETMDDIDGISVLVFQIMGMFRWEKLIISISCFVPKPWTPFQWVSMEDEKSLSRKIARLRGALRQSSNIEVMSESPREAVVQGVLARGDRRLQDALLRFTENDVSWRTALREGGIDAGFYAHRSRYLEEIFPWDYLDLGIRKKYLWEEYKLALRNAVSPPCVVDTCKRCGVCL